MAFKDFPGQEQGVALLQRSLARGRLGHAYLFAGSSLARLETLARALAKTLNCQRPVRNNASRMPTDSCDTCASCRKIDNDAHADMHWVRPESKSRVIVIDRMRDLMHEVNLKPAEAEHKVGVIVAADRLNVQAANAFLKTLEEPPPKSVLILLTTDPQRILETISSRCLRLNFGGEGTRALDSERKAWLAQFAEAAAAGEKSLIGRYRLLGVLASKLAETKADAEASLKAKSPLAKYEEVEPELQEKWEEELAAAIEAEYRRRRAELLADLQAWFRDVWLQTLAVERALFSLPELSRTKQVARRITARQARENLRILERTQWLLGSNVQEALALEVGLLQLHL
jgi:DNA polymerase-3 subunit delta'